MKNPFKWIMILTAIHLLSAFLFIESLIIEKGSLKQEKKLTSLSPIPPQTFKEMIFFHKEKWNWIVGKKEKTTVLKKIKIESKGRE